MSQEPKSHPLEKQHLINMLHGVTPSCEVSQQLTERGLMQFTGNQHNERWDWVRTRLTSLSEPQLWELYEEVAQPSMRENNKTDRPVLTEEARRDLRKRADRLEGRATARNEELLIKQAELWVENYRQRFAILRKTILKTPLQDLLFRGTELALPFPLPYISFAETNEELQHIWCIIAISFPEELLVLREFRFTRNGHDSVPIEPPRLRYTPFGHYTDAPQLAHLLNLLEAFVYEGTGYLLDGAELEHFQGVLDAKLKTEAETPSPTTEQ